MTTSERCVFFDQARADCAGCRRRRMLLEELGELYERARRAAGTLSGRYYEVRISFLEGEAASILVCRNKELA